MSGTEQHQVDQSQSTNFDPAPQQEHRELKKEDALSYLDEVKRQFADQPQVYTAFVDIMKSFKAETINTPGVIQKVSELFRGHDNLILGFNAFLPPGYKIDTVESVSVHQAPPAATVPAPSATLSLPPPSLQPQVLPQPAIIIPQGTSQANIMEPSFFASPPTYFDQHHPHYMMMMGGDSSGVPHISIGATGNQIQLSQHSAQQNLNPQIQQGQPGEFDHAINYVTRIKKRFAHDAETYKAFLDILHTYQKEQKSIKEVLDQVSELFKDHADLLKDFTYFLPDGVREKAKQEINKINSRRRKEESRKEKKDTIRKDLSLRVDNKEKQNNSNTELLSSQTAAFTKIRREKGGSESVGDDAEENAISDEKPSPAFSKEELLSPLIGKIPRTEKRLFGRIKAALLTRERWGEFLKCIDLFTQEVLSRAELMSLATELFGSNAELLEEFDRLLASRGASDENVEDGWLSVPLSEIDFSHSRRASPSYRSLPPNYPKPSCSERTALCRSVLNDVWVAVPTESDFGFKGRKNPYEEAIFKCEDDRYELDMVMEANNSTISILETLLSEIQENPAMKSTSYPILRFKLDKRTLSIVHLKSIARVYGSRSDEIFELLKKSPCDAIPVILQRLKAKAEEWKSLRASLNEHWKEVLEKNYLKSLDHRSYFFKQNERKNLLPRAILAEVKLTEKSQIWKFGNSLIHRDIYGFIVSFAEKTFQKLELDRFLSIFARVVESLFQIPVQSLQTRGGQLRVGSLVLTSTGMGVVQACSQLDQVEVKLDDGSRVKVSSEDICLSSLQESENIHEKEDLYVGQTGFLFLRYYQMVFDRISQAEILCAGKIPDEKTSFPKLLELIQEFLRNPSDFNHFEDQVGLLAGNQAYFLYTIDKLILALIKSAQSMINEERALRVVENLVRYERRTLPQFMELYRLISDATLIGTACAGAKISPGSGQILVEFLESISAGANEGQEPSLQVLIPVAVNWRKTDEIVPLFQVPLNQRKRSDADVVSVSLFRLEQIAGSEEVLRKIMQFKQEFPTEKNWWKTSNTMERTLSPVPEETNENAEENPGNKKIRVDE